MAVFCSFWRKFRHLLIVSLVCVGGALSYSTDVFAAMLNYRCESSLSDDWGTTSITGTPPSSADYNAGATVTIATNPNVGGCERSGYDFNGWVCWAYNTEDDSSNYTGLYYLKSGDTFGIHGDVICYADWVKTSCGNGTVLGTSPITNRIGQTPVAYQGNSHMTTYQSDTWTVTFSDGSTVTGTDACNYVMSGQNVGYANLFKGLDINRGGQAYGVDRAGCWCKATGYTPYGGTTQNVDSTRWVFVGMITTGICGETCPQMCADAQSNQDGRSRLYSGKKCQYTVTLDSSINNSPAPNPGTSTIYTVFGDGGYLDSSRNYRMTDAANPITVPTRNDNMSFDSYVNNNNLRYINDSGYADGLSLALIEQNTTLYAAWRSYPVLFLPGDSNNDGTGTTAEGQKFSATSAVQATVVLPRSGPFWMQGYRFTGWECNGQFYTQGSSFTITEETKCVAQWEKIECPNDGVLLESPLAKDYLDFLFQNKQNMTISTNGSNWSLESVDGYYSTTLTITGTSLCSETQETPWPPILTPSSGVVSNGSGRYCWCKLTGYDNEVINYYPWLWGNYDYCTQSDCASACADAVADTLIHGWDWNGTISGWGGCSGDVFDGFGASECSLNDKYLLMGGLTCGYDISLNKNGGSDGTSELYTVQNVDVFLDSKYEYPMSTISNPANLPSRTNYDFAGYRSQTNGGTEYTNSSGYINAAGSNAGKTIGQGDTWYAAWKGKQYQVSYLPGLHGSYDSGYSAANAVFGPGEASGGVTYNETWSTRTLAQTHISADTGYTFRGWSRNQNAVYGTDTLINPGTTQPTWTGSGNETLYAIFSPNEHTISYTCGSATTLSSIPSDNVVFGGGYNLRSNVDLYCNPGAGNVLGGWRCDYTLSTGENTNTTYSALSSLTGTFNTDHNVLCAAQWTPGHTITYYNGVNVLNLTPSMYAPGTTSLTLPTLSDESRTGLTFIGWCDGSNTCGINDVLVGTVNTTGWNTNKTFYAKWTTSVTYQAGSHGTATDDYVVDNILTGQSYTLLSGLSGTGITADAGYRLSGWVCNDNENYAVGATVYLNAPLVCVAQWAINTYSISYNLNYTGAPNWNTDANHTTSAIYDQIFNVPNPERVGYVFDGWLVSGMDTTTHYSGTDNPPTTQFNTATLNTLDTYFKNLTDVNGATVTFTAQWTPISYNLSYVLGTGGDWTSNDTPSHLTSVNYDETFFVPYNPIRTGYTFNGWNVTGMDSTSHYKGGISGDLSVFGGTSLQNDFNTVFKNLRSTPSVTPVTFTAQWNANSFNVQYAGGGNTGGSAPLSPTGCTYGDSSCVAPNNTYVKTGNAFVHWACSVNGGGSCAQSTYEAGDDISTAISTNNGTITLTAVWAQTYSVTYQNGNSCNYGNNTPASVVHSNAAIDGQSYTVLNYHSISPDLTHFRDDLPSSSCQYFSGWDRNPNATVAEFDIRSGGYIAGYINSFNHLTDSNLYAVCGTCTSPNTYNFHLAKHCSGDPNNDGYVYVGGGQIDGDYYSVFGPSCGSTFQYPTSADVSAKNFQLASGYELLGWTSNQNGTVAQYAPGESFTVSGCKAMLDLYAVCGKKHYDVVYNIGAHAATGATNYTDAYNSGTGTGGVEYGDTYTILSSATIDINAATNYTLCGWSQTQNDTCNNALIQGDTTSAWTTDASMNLYAIYDCASGFHWNTGHTECETDVSYTVTYQAGTNGSGTDYVETNLPAGSHTLLDATGLASNTDFAPGSGYTSLSKWVCGAAEYNPGGTIILSGNVTCVAKWTPIVYNISYDTRGGVRDNSWPSSASYNQVFNVSNPTRSGDFTFYSWYISGMDTTTHYTGTDNPPTTSVSNANLVTSNTYFKNLRASSGTVSFVAMWVAKLQYGCGEGSGYGRVEDYFPCNTVNSPSCSVVVSGVTGANPVSCTAPTGKVFDKWTCDNSIGDKQPGQTFNMPDAKVTCAAQWKPVYAVSYAGGDSNNNGTGTAASGNMSSDGLTGQSAGVTITLPSNSFVLPGYTFNGWNCGSDISGTRQPGQTFVLPAHDVTCTAQWTPNCNTITLDANGGTGGTSTLYKKSGNTNWYTDANCATTVTTLNSLPSKTNYVYGGHNMQQNGSGTTRIAHDGRLDTSWVVNSNQTIYAQWATATHSISYRPDNNSGVTYSESGVGVGTQYTLETNLTILGMTAPTDNVLSGWSCQTISPAANVAVNNNEIQMPDADVLCTAQWSPAYRVWYYCPGGQTSGLVDNNFYQFGQTVNLPSTYGNCTSTTGYHFDGWRCQYYDNVNSVWQYINGGFKIYQIQTMPLANVTCQPHSEANCNTITLHTNGGTGGTSTLYKLSGNSGWYTTSDCSSTGYVSSLPVAPSKSGYVYNGHNTQQDGSGETKINPNSSLVGWFVNSDQTIYAQWVCPEHYQEDSNTGQCVLATHNITYDTNAPSGTTVTNVPSPNPYSVQYNTTYTLSSSVPAATGYTFAGWSCPNLTGTPGGANGYFAPGDTGTYTYDGNVTCTAQWTPNCNTITLDPNQGVLGSSPAVLYKKSGDTDWYDNSSCTGTAVTTLQSLPNRNDYTYNGHAFSNAIVINSSGALSNSWTVNANQTIYAQWTMTATNIEYIDSLTELTISGLSPTVYVPDSTITMPSLPRKPGYIFAGWCEGNANCDVSSPTVTTTMNDEQLNTTGWVGNKTFYAMWVEDKFQITTPITMQAGSEFEFMIGAKGVFYVDCGGDGVLRAGYGVNGVNKTRIVRTTTTLNSFYCYYPSGGTVTIHFGGAATEYDSAGYYFNPAITFQYSNSLVSSVSGSLGAVFGTIGTGGTLQTQPRFYDTFRGCSLLQSVPGGLFSGVTGEPVPYMFSGTFYQSGLTSVPAGLFSGIQGSPAMYMFDSTFYGCTSLASIPAGLFSGIQGSPATSMFRSTFMGCTSLTSIPAGLFSGIQGSPVEYMFASTFKGCTSLTSVPAGLFSGIQGSPAVWMFSDTFKNCNGISYFTDANGNQLTATIMGNTVPVSYIPGDYMEDITETTYSSVVDSNYNYRSMHEMFASTNLPESCPAGTYKRDTAFNLDWAPKVSCLVCPVGTVSSAGSTGISQCTYTITYNNGALSGMTVTGMPSPSSVSVSYGSNYTLASAPSATGYIFDGWDCPGLSGVTQSNGYFEAGYSYACNTNATCTAKWSPVAYNINYVLNYTGAPVWNNETTHPTIVYYNGVFNVAHPERAGYTFAGWNITNMNSGIHYSGTTSANLTQLNATTNVLDTYFKNLRSEAGTVVFTAQWTPKNYTVTYDKGSVAVGSITGNSPTTQTFVYDAQDSLTQNGYSAIGYTFGGWEPDKNLQVLDGLYPPESYADQATITYKYNGNDATLTALWVPKISGAITLNDNYYKTNGQNVSNPTHTATPRVSPGSVYSVYGVAMYDTSAHAATQTSPITAVATIPSLTGYDFQGFYTQQQYDGSNGVGTQVINANGSFASAATTAVSETGGTATWYAKWVANQYSVNYSCDGGTAVTSSNTATYESPYSFLGISNTCGSTSTGYHFPTEWACVDSQYNTVIPGNNTTSWSVADTVTCSVEPIANTLDVNYSCDGGTTVTSPDTATYGRPYTFLGVSNTCGSAVSGYHFPAGWVCVDSHNNTIDQGANEIYWGVDDTVTCSVTPVANTYNISYDANGGSYTGNYTAQTNVFGPGASNGGGTYGQSWSLQTLANAHISAPACYTFQGWNESSNTVYDGSNTLSSGQQPSPWARTTDLQLYAIYTLNNHDVIYACGTGATGTAPNTVGYDCGAQNVTVYNGAGNCVAPSANHEFDYWLCQAGGTTYADDTNNQFNMPDADVTCTAQWRLKTYNITYINTNNNNPYQNLTPTTYVTGSTDTLPTPPAISDHIFTGWCVGNSNCTSSETIMGGTTIPSNWTGDKILYATWILDEFQVDTTSNPTNFVFSLTASGEYFIDWGDGTVERITKSNTTYQTISHNYTPANNGPYTIHMAGQATGYSTSDIGWDSAYGSAISFANSSSKITAVRGSLGAIFSAVNGGGTLATQPRFGRTFENCSLLQSLPLTLFENVSGSPVRQIFYRTFYGCSGLTSLPNNLFWGVSGAPAEYMFADTFAFCSGLTSIPSGLFNHIISDGTTTQPAFYMFGSTFYGCTGLAPTQQNPNPIPADLFSSIRGVPADSMFASTFKGCNHITSIPATLFSSLDGAPVFGLFQQTFSGCSALQSIPATLFNTIHGAPADSMFSETFKNCTSLVTVPQGLFSRISGDLAYGIFSGTFEGCANLTTIPGDLFSSILNDGTAQYRDQAFYRTFANCSSLASIPDQLFSSLQGAPAGSMFEGTFSGCTSLSSIPSGLFSGITSNGTTTQPAASMFNQTFMGCTGLQSIPENLFDGINGTAAYRTFYQTFKNCSNVNYFTDNNDNQVTAPINGTPTAVNYIPANYMYGINESGYANGPMTQMFTGTNLAQSCPSGTVQRVSAFNSDWSPKVSCVPSYTLSYDCNNNNLGGTVPAAPTTTNSYSSVTVPTTDSGCAVPNNAQGFDYWLCVGDISETSLTTDSNPTFSMPEENVTCYAQWDINEFNINYVDSENHNTTYNFSPSTYVVGSGGTITLQRPTRKTGKIFAGWCDGTDDCNTSLANGTIMDGTAVSTNGWTGDKTFYAMWVDDKFQITTTQLSVNGDVLYFDIGALGVFYVDCGDNGVLGGNSVSSTRIDHTSTVNRVTYTCTYSDGGVKTIRFGGVATSYHTYYANSAFRISTTASTKSKVAALSGDLSVLFPYYGSVDGQYPHFYSAFSSCPNLTSIDGTLFSHYTDLTGAQNTFENLFYGCTGLTTIPSGLFSSITAGASNLFRQTFHDCTGLAPTVANNNTPIPENLFAGITAGVEYLFNNTFSGCAGLTSIPEDLFSNITTSAQSMFYQTFMGCTGLTSIPEDLFGNITTGATQMFGETFSGCSGLTTLPSGLFSNLTTGAQSMFSRTFYNCTGLTTIPSNFKFFANNVNGAPGMFYGTFWGCTHLTSIPSEIFSRVTTGAEYMFQGTFALCSALTTIPANLFATITTSGAYMYASTFTDCTGLTTIPSNFVFFANNVSGAEYMFQYTFSNCNNLTSIPSGIFNRVTSGAMAMFYQTFSSCTGLTSIPSGLFANITGAQSEFYRTFNDCRGLTSVPVNLFANMSGSPAQGMFSNMFNGCTNLGYFSDDSGNQLTEVILGNETGIYYIPKEFLANLEANYDSSLYTSPYQMPAYRMFDGTQLITSCPNGTSQRNSVFNDGWDPKVSCIPDVSLIWETGTNQSVTAPASCVYGATNGITGIVQPDRPGYVFKGWTVTNYD